MPKSSMKPYLMGLMSFLLTTVQAFSAQAEYAPERLQALVGTKLTHHGPNCWNSVLVGSGVLKHVRFTSATEFRFFMDSAACKKIPSGQQQVGDIQVYYRTMPSLPVEMREVHANIWLSHQSAFNKMTNFAPARYEITSHESVNKNYARTPEIIRFNLENPVRLLHCRGDECINSVEYRRCDSVEALKKADAHYSEEIEKLISSLEENIESELSSPYLESAEMKSLNRGILQQIQSEVQKTCGQAGGFYCGYVRRALTSLHWQLTQIQPSWLVPQP